MSATIIWAPSDVTAAYPPESCKARANTLALPKSTLPKINPINIPILPLGTQTDGGCDTTCPYYEAWTSQISTLEIHDDDFLIAADLPAEPFAGTQEIWNVLQSKGIKNLVYMGVHENMCILNRPFAIEKMLGLGWKSNQIAVVRELVDVMYTPKDPPYVSHDAGLDIHTTFIEKFLATSVSMYDWLALSYNCTN